MPADASPPSASPPLPAMFPAKLCYFCLFSALSAYTPFLTVFLESVRARGEVGGSAGAWGVGCIVNRGRVLLAQSGLSPSQIGILRMMLPAAGLVAQPLWAALADRLHCHRLVLLGTMTGGTLLRCCIGLLTVAMVQGGVAPPYYFWVIFMVMVVSEGECLPGAVCGCWRVTPPRSCENVVSPPPVPALSPPCPCRRIVAVHFPG